MTTAKYKRLNNMKRLFLKRDSISSDKGRSVFEHGNQKYVYRVWSVSSDAGVYGTFHCRVSSDTVLYMVRQRAIRASADDWSFGLPQT